MPSLEADVIGSIRVDLKFLISASKGVDLDFPFRKIQGVTVELIAPNGLPCIALGHGSRCPKMQTQKRTKKESVKERQHLGFSVDSHDLDVFGWSYVSHDRFAS
jgi:hypothetical protein